jgi:DNA-binding winged helix-turn-helix (wHTH) protein
MKLSFGDCSFDDSVRELRRDGRAVALTPKAFELLSLLIERRPKAVSKADIRDRLWPKTFVSDVNLAALAFEVRSAIGDDARKPRYLRTVRGFGYAFVGESGRSSTTTVRLVLDDREVALAEGDHVLGRGDEAEIVLDRARVSRLHARVRVRAGGVTLEDLGSKNGTYHRGRRIEAPVALADGDEIRIGTERIVFRSAGRDVPTESAARAAESE